MPSDPLGVQLHHKLLTGDPTATALLAENYLAEICGRLGRTYPNLADPAWIEDATHTAFLNYFRKPNTYDPAKSPLSTFLYMAARSDLLNLMDRKKRLDNHQPISLDSVELVGRDAEYIVDEYADPGQYDWDAPARLRALRHHLVAILPDPVDRQLAELIIDDVRETATYAALLGIEDLEVAQQQTQVKKHKDRIKARLKRAKVGTSDE